MKIINQHLGLPVISLDTSERAGDVVRFITDQVSGRIVAVAVTRKWYQEPHGVLFEDCRAFGQNVVLISRVDALRPLSQIEDVSVHLEASNDARQRTAITEGGRLLGSVTDEAFDEETSEVTGYRLDVIAETGTARTVYIPHSTFVTSSATVAILAEDVLARAKDTLEELGTESLGSGVREAEPSPASRPEPAPPSETPPTAGPTPATTVTASAAPPTAAPMPPPSAVPPPASAVGTASAPSAGPGAWAGSEDVAYAAPAEVVAPPAPTHAPAADEDEALFEDVAPSDEDEMPLAEEFAPTTPDYEPEGMGEAAAEGPAMAGSTAVATPPPAAAPQDVSAPPPAAGLQGHDRIMMALSLGQVARSTVRDPAGNVLVEAGQTITADMTQAAARAGADTLYALWTATQESSAES